jgi:hypothetical protein
MNKPFNPQGVEAATSVDVSNTHIEMNAIPLPAPAALDAREGDNAALLKFEAALLNSVDTGPMRASRQLALTCLQHAVPLDPTKGAAYISIHHKINFADGREPIYPGSAHTDYNTAIKTAFYWADKGHCVYWSTPRK